jgi:hypothetical protein
MAEKETEIVTGTVVGIIQKGADKWQVEVRTDLDSQYTKKLWTKKAETQALAAALIEQIATFECGVSHWKLDDGTPTQSLWINAVNPGAPPPTEPPGAEEARQGVAQEATGATQSASEASGGSAPTTNHSAPPSDPTRRSIERQTSLIQAVAYAPVDLAVQTVDGVLAVAEDFYAYLTFTNPGRTHPPISPDEEIPF